MAVKYKKIKIEKEPEKNKYNKKRIFLKGMLPLVLTFSLGRISASVDIVDLLNKFTETNKASACDDAIVQYEPTAAPIINSDIDSIITPTFSTEIIKSTENLNNSDAITPTEKPPVIPSDEYSFVYQDESVIDLQDNITDYPNVLDVGSDENVYMVESFLDPNTYTGECIQKYSEMYGVDPNVIASICMQETTLQHYECCPGGDRYFGYGVGLMQLECPAEQISDAREITAYNYQTNSYDSEYITMENACDLEKNIKIGCMLFQNNLENNNGNILLSIVAHNYGQPMVDLILDSTYGDSENVKLQYDNISWLEDMQYAHNNPNVYLDNWLESSYGDGEYLKHVLRYCPTNLVKYKHNNKEYCFDLIGLKIISVQELNLGSKVM